MEYSAYKKSIMIPDQSAWQQIAFTLTQPNPIDVLGFLKQQEITANIPLEAENELGYQAYKPNLFSGIHYGNNSTIESRTLGIEYTFSKTNASLTPIDLQPNGLGVNVVKSKTLYSQTFRGQLFLWDTTSTMKKLSKNKRSLVDSANIILARCFQKEGKNFFVFVNDQKQINQLKYEGIRYLRPDKLFTWMYKDGYIDPRKKAWNFKKRRIHNNRWTN